MATIIVNPTAASNGSGSLIDPKNTYTGLSVSSGDVVLQVAGTTFAGQVAISAAGVSDSMRTVYGVCEPQTGNRITDGSRRATIDATGQTYGMNVAVNAHYVTIDGFEIFGVNSGTTRRGIRWGSNSTNVTNFVVVSNCYVHDIEGTTTDSNGIGGFGSDYVLRGNVITNIATDGIWAQGARGLIEHNKISNVGADGRLLGDCVQVFGDSTLGSGGIIVRYNELDHSVGSFKQCVIIQTTGSDTGGMVYGNDCIMAAYDGENNNAIFLEIPGSVCFGNRVRGGRYLIFINANNVRVIGNLVTGGQYGINQGAVTGAKIYNNTVIDQEISGIYGDNDTTLDIRNNIVSGCATGISFENGATENYNCVFDCDTSVFSLGGGAVSLGAQSITSDPLLDANYRPRSGSPCIGAGTFITGAKHYGGVVMNPNSPDIGAHRYFTARSTTTRSTTTRSTTTRNTALNREVVPA